MKRVAVDLDLFPNVDLTAFMRSFEGVATDVHLDGEWLSWEQYVELLKQRAEEQNTDRSSE